MRVVVTEDSVEVRLAPWQKVLGLMRDTSVQRVDVSEVRLVEDPLAETMTAGIKVGLRIPWLYYLARSIRLDRVFIVRRGVPALSFAVANHHPLRHVLVSTPEAAELVRRLGG
jgi:hypothetical protein